MGQRKKLNFKLQMVIFLSAMVTGPPSQLASFVVCSSGNSQFFEAHSIDGQVISIETGCGCKISSSNTNLHTLQFKLKLFAITLIEIR